LKVLYNIFSNNKVGLDKWTFMDTISAVLNILAIQVIKRVSPLTYLTPRNKDYIDYFMILVLCVSWLRFFVYFLVVRNVSKLILTLIAMIGDTISFMFIVCCFILIMASIFTTLYQDTNAEKYGGLALTVRTLFDAAIGQYDFSGMQGRDISHSVLLIFHVFCSNILLMNYLVAILSTTYENMKQTGVFRYKVNLYQYCERFIKAFSDRTYGEMVLHPPPLSYANLILIPYLVNRKAMAKISTIFSYVLYWLENTFFIFGFFMFEFAVCPLAYLKVWVNIFRNSANFLNLFFYCILWLIFGLPITVYLVLNDVFNLIRLMTYYKGCRYGMKDLMADEKLDAKAKI
jgi:hypothetical protein